MNDSFGQSARPSLFVIGKLLFDLAGKATNDQIGAVADGVEERPPAGKRQAVGAGLRKAFPGDVELPERSAQACALLDRGAPYRDAVEKIDERGRPAGKPTQGAALLVMDGKRAAHAARGEVLHQ